MPESMFENIPSGPVPEKKPEQEIKKEESKKKEQKEHIESEKPPKLIILKPQEKFLVPDSDTPNRVYQVATKYKDNRIEVFEVGTTNRFIFDGDTIIIPVPRERKVHK